MKQNLRFVLVLGWPAVLKISALVLKYTTFMRQNKYKIRLAMQCTESLILCIVVFTKKLINIKVRKL